MLLDTLMLIGYETINGLISHVIIGIWQSHQLGYEYIIPPVPRADFPRNSILNGKVWSSFITHLLSSPM